jgi:serine/threonine protein kinase
MGSKEGYGKSSDWWALGILVYELLTGHPPFYDMKPLGIYQKILKGIIEFPAFLSLRAKDLIRKLLNPDVKYRIGVSDVKFKIIQNGDSVKTHKWFKGVDWDMVFQRKIPAPWVPFLRN